MQTYRISETARYLLTGSLSVGLNLLIICLLTEVFGLHYLLSICVCFVTVTLVSFYLNRTWTFRKLGGELPPDLARFVLVSLTQLVLSVTLCGWMVERLGLPYPLVVAALSVVFVPLTYLVHRGWSFRLNGKPSVPGGQGQ
jgi:putative flippase GtrA